MSSGASYVDLSDIQAEARQEPVVSDTVLTFGSHKGETPQQLPTDYIQWMVREIKKDKSSAFRIQSRDSILRELATEMEVRLSRDPSIHFDLSPTEMLEQASVFGGGRVVVDYGGSAAEPTWMKNQDGETIEKVTGPFTWTIDREAIDDISKNIPLMKQFFTRIDQQKGLWTWLRELASEALRHGQHGGHLSSGDFYEYGGLDFQIKKIGRDIKLMSVTSPHPAREPPDAG